MPISFSKGNQEPTKKFLFLLQQCAECNHILKHMQVNIFRKGQPNACREFSFPSSKVCNRVQSHSHTQSGQYISQRAKSTCREFSSTVCNRAQPHSKTQVDQYLSQRATKCQQINFCTFFNSLQQSANTQQIPTRLVYFLKGN